MMINKQALFLLAVVLMLGLAACSGNATQATPVVAAAASGDQPQQQGTALPGQANPADMPVTAKLAAGTLLLEETDDKVDAAQAQSLLPLWKAVRTMSSSQTASAAEIDAIYQQIQETMTAEQIAAIEEMGMAGEEMSALMEKLGIEMRGPGGGGGNPMDDLSDEERATRIAEFRSQAGSSGQGGPGGFPGGGQPPAGGGGPNFQFQGGGPGGEGFPQGTDGATQATPDPAQMARRQSMGMNAQFLDALIQLLEARAKS